MLLLFDCSRYQPWRPSYNAANAPRTTAPTPNAAASTLFAEPVLVAEAEADVEADAAVALDEWDVVALPEALPDEAAVPVATADPEVEVAEEEPEALEAALLAVEAPVAELEAQVAV